MSIPPYTGICNGYHRFRSVDELTPLDVHMYIQYAYTWCLISLADTLITWSEQYMYCTYYEVMARKRFPHYWTFVREPTGHGWIPLTNTSNVALWCFVCCWPKQTLEQTVGLLVICDAMTPTSHHCNTIDNYVSTTATNSKYVSCFIAAYNSPDV